MSKKEREKQKEEGIVADRRARAGLGEVLQPNYEQIMRAMAHALVSGSVDEDVRSDFLAEFIDVVRYQTFKNVDTVFKLRDKLRKG